MAAEGLPVSPTGGGGAGRGLTHAEFEMSLLTARLAENSAAHRGHARAVVDDLVGFVRAFPDAENQSELVARMAVTSDEATHDRIRDAGLMPSREVRSAAAAQRLEHEIFADAMGVATWAIGVDPRGEVPVARIELVPDERVQFALLAWSHIFAFA